MTRLWLLLGSFLFAGALSGGCARRGAHPSEEKAALQKQLKAARGAAPKALASAVISGGQIQIGDEQGRPLYTLAAKEIRALSGKDGAPEGALATQASGTLFKEGRAETHLKADTIRAFNASPGARLLLQGNVVTTSLATGAPVEVRAPRADINVPNHLLVASGGVVATRGDVTLRAPQLRGQSSLQQLSCANAFVVTPNVQMKAQSATFNWKANRLSAQRVTATQPDVQLTGAQLRADTNVQSGTLTGDVVAKGRQGTARGPRLDFNWKTNRIFVPQATFAGQGGTATMNALATDSKLRVTDAQNVRASQNGATLTVGRARGFDNLARLSGSGVRLVRGDLTLDAPSAQVRDWSKATATIIGTGGVRARNREGTLSASSATWTGTAGDGRVEARGDVSISGAQGTLRGQSATSDARFQNAQISGDVSGTLRDGTRLRGQKVEKRGENYLASGGASALLPSGTRLSASEVRKTGNFLVATGGVRALVPSQKGVGRVEVRAPRVEGPLDQSQFIASGGVVLVSQNGTVVTAPRAVFNRRTNRITATGGVVVKDPQRGTLRGASLVADLGLKQVEILRGEGVGKTQSGSPSVKGLF